MRYLNIRNGKFTFANTVIGPQIDAQLRLMGKRFLQWTSNGLVGERICHDEAQIPNGWTLAYDFDLELNNITYRLTIHDGSIQHGFKPYIAILSSINSRLEDVVTRITIENNTRGYPVLKFEIV
ncbi:hypothetical protein SYK_27980 [Pseudodesulfovibrio nedwellii]|uniref:Uncharacterized protein n=1 Tax=Pseudodesulfovibrio nedwellii TaxID=2973072 RepID=A0ABM8B3P0_9BACT|nr:hypothetical protein [Pseudodesulfovibrio nedwellii]BDQ38438.1 hypothetical protein SYK_27980 [Pseudodesulfovibrio nedwellii]